MPYSNEHSCRLVEPIKDAKTRRAEDEREHEGKKYSVIYQEGGDRTWHEQAYRYATGVWTAASAKSHCKSHDGILFEPASGGDEKKEDFPGDRWKRASVVGILTPTADVSELVPIVGPDRNAEVIRGMILAQEGPFKSEGRGEFDRQSLEAILRLAASTPNGLKSRFTHPDLSNDGLGKFLGRITDTRMDFIARRESQGQLKVNRIAVVRGDLHIDPSSHTTPSGDIGKYVMDLAHSDPDAMSSSLVLETDEEYRLKPDGTPMLDDEGNALPPLWRPLALHACDLVDTGDAVDGLLSVQLDADGLPDGVVRQAAALMEKQFAGKSPEFIRDRCIAWLDRFLVRKFGLADKFGDWPDKLATGDGAAESDESQSVAYDPNRDAVKRRWKLRVCQAREVLAELALRGPPQPGAR